jgi:ABC-type multidrug transport system permease subunit
MTRKLKIVYIVTVLALTTIAFCIMYFLIHLKLKMSLMFSVVPAIAMLIADSIAFRIKQKKDRKVS